MSNRLTSASDSPRPQFDTDLPRPPQESASQISLGETYAKRIPLAEYAAPESNGVPLEDHELQTSHSEAFATSPHHREDSDDSAEADPVMEPGIALDEQPDDSSSPSPILDAAESIELLESPTESPSEPASPPAESIRINVDTYNWGRLQAKRMQQNVEGISYNQSHSERLNQRWVQQIGSIQYKILHSPDKEQCGLKCIAETYIQSFFPEIKQGNEEYKNKVKQIEEMLTKDPSGPVGHHAFSTEGYEDTAFFNQVVGPLRQLIIFTFTQKALLEDSEALQDFFEKFVIFNTMAQTAIAAVEGLEDTQLFKAASTGRNSNPLGDTFGEARAYFLQWMGDDEFPPDPYDCDAVRPDSLPDDYDDQKNTRLNGAISVYGGIMHSRLNMLFVGSDIFKECITEAQHLKENKEDPEALAAFTQSMKKLIYVWSQSTTCNKGQTATLEILVDSIAQYAGFKLESPKIPKEVKTALEDLAETYDPNNEEYDPNYEDRSRYYGSDRGSNEEFLEEFYHANTFALYMDSFEKFDQRYPCTFAPINSETDEINILQQIFQPETQPLAASADSVSPIPPPEPPPATAHTRVDVDHYDWASKQLRNVSNGRERERIIFVDRSAQSVKELIQNKIKSIDDKAEYGRQYIAEVYIDLFFPEITDESQYASKFAEIKQRLINESHEQADLRTLTPGGYGNESFFNQTADPLRQLIAEAFERQVFDLDDDFEMQIFSERIVQFSTIIRAIIAAVANSENMESFGEIMTPTYGTPDIFGILLERKGLPHDEIPLRSIPPSTPDVMQKLRAQANRQFRDVFLIDYDIIRPNEPLYEYNSCVREQFNFIFSEPQSYLARWLAADSYPLDSSQWDALKLGQRTNRAYQKQSPFGCVVNGNGSVKHSHLSMLYVGSDIFKDIMKAAKHLKENPEDPEALAAFTQAIKKFMYTWSQSSTCHRGQAAILMMLVDSMAKYAGFQFKRPEVPDEARTALAQLAERFPDRDRVEGDETETTYAIQTEVNGELMRWRRNKDEKWLQDLYYHCDVFALLMPSFEAFDERYLCEFVPLPTNETPPETT
ncbi:MAG: hypothetical protein LBD60_02145 [Puniceicoccales bacterium]|jgi:hypothetical protein|nr:hypothetical protein [Puniceicoccales bacterium]